MQDRCFRRGHPDGEQPGRGNSVLVESVLVAEGDERTRLRVVESGLELMAWPNSRRHDYAEDHRQAGRSPGPPSRRLLWRRRGRDRHGWRQLTAELDDELWSAIADLSRRRVLDLLVRHGAVTASWLARQLPFSRQAVATSWWPGPGRAIPEHSRSW